MLPIWVGLPSDYEISQTIEDKNSSTAAVPTISLPRFTPLKSKPTGDSCCYCCCPAAFAAVADLASAAAAFVL